MSTHRTNEIEEIASEWLLRRESGYWTEADQVHLEQWLDASTLNRVAFLRLELAWEESARLKALGAGLSADRAPLPGHWHLTPFLDSHRTVSETNDTHDSGIAPNVSAEAFGRRRPQWRLVIAASVLVAVAATFGAYHFWNGSADHYTTPVGGLSSVPMLDGSQMTLNTNSQVRVAVTEAERRVDLEQGEAFFEVAKDPSRPFVVAAGNKRVVAVGTKFSVRRDGGFTEVIVIEGEVRVEEAERHPRSRAVDASRSATPEDASATVFLSAGAIARANEAGISIQRTTLPEAETRLSWRVGMLMFRDLSLADAIAEFNRYNVRKIVIADPAVAALKVEGNFRATNVDAFVRLIESGFPVRSSAEDDHIVLSSR